MTDNQAKQLWVNFHGVYLEEFGQYWLVVCRRTDRCIPIASFKQALSLVAEYEGDEDIFGSGYIVLHRQGIYDRQTS